MATICWASTSSGLRGTTVGSMSPSRMRLRHDRALEQVGAELREDAPARDLAHAVAGAADALEPGGDRLGRLDLDHQVHGAHVDAELERRGGHEAGQLARLEQVLDDQPLLAGERAVVGAGDVVAPRPRCRLLGGQLVQPHGEPLRAAAAVHEDDRRAVLLDQPQQLGVDRRPDRARGGGLGRRAEPGADQVAAAGGRAHAAVRRGRSRRGRRARACSPPARGS